MEQIRTHYGEALRLLGDERLHVHYWFRLRNKRIAVAVYENSRRYNGWYALVVDEASLAYTDRPPIKMPAWALR